ncbi:MAG: SipW-dependent-type signal peptide-containing protein [Bulleidia sp.]
MKKKFLAFATVFALAAVAVVGGTMAYFTDKDAKDNEFTVGNVKIALVEQQNGFDEESQETTLVPFEDGKVLMPGINNAVDKIVSVKNIGANDAYVRVKITVPSDIKDVIKLIPNEGSKYWDELLDEDNISDDEKTGDRTYTVIYSEIVAPDTVTEDVLSKVYLDDTVNYENDGEGEDGYYYVVTNDDGTTKRQYISLDPESVVVKVVAEAIQADGFDTAEKAFEAYDAQK